MAMCSKDIPFLVVCEDIVGFIGHHGSFGNGECLSLAARERGQAADCSLYVCWDGITMHGMNVQECAKMLYPTA